MSSRGTDRHAAATRAADEAWGKAGAVELQCQAASDYSSSLTAVRLSEGHSADGLRGHCHVGDFYLSTARSGHRPQTRKIRGLESSSVVLDPSKIRYSWRT